MKNTIAALCVLGVLCWAAGAWAQGQGKGRQQRPTRTEKPAQQAEAAKGKAAKDAAAAKEQAAEAKQQAQQKRAGQQAEAARGKAARDAEAAKGQGAGKAAEARGKAGKDVEATEKAGQAKGKGHQQQMRAFEAQQQRHQAKHMERQARLARIRELAVQKGDAEMIARVDKLIAKEQQVHERKGVRLQEQKRAMTGTESGAAPTVQGAPKGNGAGKSGVPKADRPDDDETPEEPEVEAETQQAPPAENAPQEAPPQN